jgi:hypothetical protein
MSEVDCCRGKSGDARSRLAPSARRKDAGGDTRTRERPIVCGCSGYRRLAPFLLRPSTPAKAATVAPVLTLIAAYEVCCTRLQGARTMQKRSGETRRRLPIMGAGGSSHLLAEHLVATACRSDDISYPQRLDIVDLSRPERCLQGRIAA